MHSLTVCSRETASTKLPFPAVASAIEKSRDNNGFTSVYIENGLYNRELKSRENTLLPQKKKLSTINTLYGRKLRNI